MWAALLGRLIGIVGQRHPLPRAFSALLAPLRRTKLAAGGWPFGGAGSTPAAGLQTRLEASYARQERVLENPRRTGVLPHRGSQNLETPEARPAKRPKSSQPAKSRLRAELPALLFVAQRLDGCNRGGTARGKERGQDTDRQKDGNRDCEGQRVVGLDPVEERRAHACRGQR